MEMIDRRDFPILFIDDEVGIQTTEGWKTAAIVEELEDALDCTVYNALSCHDGQEIVKSHAELGCVVIDWDIEQDAAVDDLTPAELINFIRARNEDLPILLMTDKLSVGDIPTAVLSKIDGYIWITEDTPTFIAGRIETALLKYIDTILPAYFKALVKYAEEYKYAWHTPGHMGGVAFMKTPAGRACFNFFGENVFRADLSVSVPELGSLLDHEGVIGQAEKDAAKIFNANYTYFVTNGTSTANQIIWHARVTKGDISLMDRNCHKSLNYAMIVTGATPIYMMPTRNAYGTIGPIHLKEFEAETIQEKIDACPLITDKSQKVKMAVVTNSTYDGLCYNVLGIKDRLQGVVDNIHFDEAWYAYARFHPIYEKHYGMTSVGESADHPPIFTTHSTHKLLAAWSQASMIHIKNGGRVDVSPDLFNESFMMHSSTSPQYGILATLDISAKMMAGKAGRRLMQETLEEPVIFRKKMAQIAKDIASSTPDAKKAWWFTAWQPDTVTIRENPEIKDMVDVPFEEVDNDILLSNQECWTLQPGQDWHMFGKLEEDYIMLDPLKVTIATPGISKDGHLADWGIPAGIVTRWLMTKGVVVEKTGHYSWLLLFSIGITKGKSGTMLAELFKFKALYDADAPLTEMLPCLVAEHPMYADWTIQQLCDNMHTYMREKKLVEMMLDSFSILPEQAMIPADAYSELVRGDVEYCFIDELPGRVAAVMVVPYPPGIPMIMPGERYTKETQIIVDYLAAVEEFEYHFPGFEGDIHGVIREKAENGRQRFKIYCLKE
ncbi:MAG: lysine decarboxylase [Spartobacteria bacterium]|nr:lysine decarboxylase [Spartobacteria bacterium]